MDNVFDFHAHKMAAFQKKKESRLVAAEDAYRHFINGLDKLELLEEMVKFQEWRSREGHLTSEMMVKGIILFKALTEAAETDELRLLTKSYSRHLEYELKQFVEYAK